MGSRVDILTERDEAIGLFPSSYTGEVLRVRCRRANQRRWRSFLLVPYEGEGYGDLEAKAQAAAEAYLEERGL